MLTVATQPRPCVVESCSWYSHQVNTHLYSVVTVVSVVASGVVMTVFSVVLLMAFSVVLLMASLLMASSVVLLVEDSEIPNLSLMCFKFNSSSSNWSRSD